MVVVPGVIAKTAAINIVSVREINYRCGVVAASKIYRRTVVTRETKILSRL